MTQIPELEYFSPSQAPCLIRLNLKKVSEQDRFKKAAMLWVGCWLVAALTIPLVILHFFTIPGLLIAGPVLARLHYRKQWRIDDKSIPCPDCQKTIPMKPRPIQFPVSVTCPHCLVSISIRVREKSHS